MVKAYLTESAPHLPTAYRNHPLEMLACLSKNLLRHRKNKGGVRDVDNIVEGTARRQGANSSKPKGKSSC